MRELRRSSLAPLVRASLLTACLGHVACGGGSQSTTVDVPPVSHDMDAAAGSDAAAADGGQPTDAMMPDQGDAAMSGDGGLTTDAAVPTDGGANADAGPATDSGPYTGFPSGDPTEACNVTDEHAEFEQAVSFSDEAGFAVTLGSTGFGVAFQADDCGAGLGTLATLPVAATGAYRTPLVMFSDCHATVQHVSLLHIDGGFRMTWVDNSTAAAGLELQTLRLTEALGLPEIPTPTRVTTNQRTELRPAQWQLGSSHFLTWISRDPDRTHTQIEQRNSDTSDETQVLVAADSGFNLTRFAAAQLGKDRGALAFVSESSMPGAWLLPLDSHGMPSGSPALLNAYVTTGNAIDVATREVDGGAVVYSLDFTDEEQHTLRHEVRLRRLDVQGALIGDEIKLVPTPLQARDAGIARLGDGYVVGFRSLPTNGEERGEIRMMFITKEGNVQQDSVGRLITYPVTDASPDGGRVSVRISTDGQLLISFLDTAAAGTKLRLIRKRLDCAL